MAAAFYNTPDDTWRQDSGSWVYKGEWNSTISDRLYLEARYGDFGYYFPLVANTPESNTYYWRDTSLNELSGGDDRWQLARDRKQATAAATYFKDNLLGGNHSFKFGGEVLLETGWEGYLSERGRPHRPPVQQQRRDAGHLRLPDRDGGREPSCVEGRPEVDQQARSHQPVPERSVFSSGG